MDTPSPAAFYTQRQKAALTGMGLLHSDTTINRLINFKLDCTGTAGFSSAAGSLGLDVLHLVPHHQGVL